MAVLVTGGAGYIGSHMIWELLKNKEEAVVVDNLSKGHKQAVLCDRFYQGDLRDDNLMDRIFGENQIDSVIHFAADSLVGESMITPLKYYENNIYSTARLLHHMIKNSCNNIVFSSTAAVYGEPKTVPITEDMNLNPLSTYGESKLMVERMLKRVEQAHGINYMALRYFNACGAQKEGLIGEDHRPETHLIPKIVLAAMGYEREIEIYGDDYNTHDGTCIRDYIYIEDLTKAHLLALKKMRQENKSGIYNLGSQKGYSVREIIRASEEVTGNKLNVKVSKRRPGDPPVLIASGEKAYRDLNFKPENNNINDIIESVLKFFTKHPGGYNG